VGIRSFHEFDATATQTVVCRSVSSSNNFRIFQFNYNSDFRTPIKRVLEHDDFNNGTFLIIEKEEVILLAKIITDDLKKNQLTVSIFSPPLPSRKFSISKSAPTIITTTNVIGCFSELPAKTMFNIIVLSDQQFISIQDICDEF
jgi:hypothetical protein